MILLSSLVGEETSRGEGGNLPQGRQKTNGRAGQVQRSPEATGSENILPVGLEIEVLECRKLFPTETHKNSSHDKAQQGYVRGLFSITIHSVQYWRRAQPTPAFPAAKISTFPQENRPQEPIG